MLQQLEKVNLMSQQLWKNEVLKKDNWIAWKSLILQNLWANCLDGFLLGKELEPSKDMEPAEHDAWDMIDQTVIQYIKSNIHCDQLITIPQFLEINNSVSIAQMSAETWNVLCQISKSHTSQSAYNLFQTLCKMACTKKTSNNILSHLVEMQNLHMKSANLDYLMVDNLFNSMYPNLGTTILLAYLVFRLAVEENKSSFQLFSYLTYSNPSTTGGKLKEMKNKQMMLLIAQVMQEISENANATLIIPATFVTLLITAPIIANGWRMAVIVLTANEVEPMQNEQ